MERRQELGLGIVGLDALERRASLGAVVAGDVDDGLVEECRQLRLVLLLAMCA